MKICVVGTGYVGLVSGTCLAAIGHDVMCVDVDAAKVERINRADPPIHEDGLPELLKRVAGTKLKATTSLEAAMEGADVALICVGTPFDGTTIDLHFVRQVAQEIGRVLRTSSHYCVVTVKSTVVPGTTDTVVRQELEAASGKVAGRDFGLGMNPEFLAEGVAIKDFMEPDRIVLGGLDERSTDVLARMYESFVRTPIMRTTPRTAEMIKYAANTLLATLISYANELARICDGIGDLDAADVFKGLHMSKHLTRRDSNGELKLAGATSYLWAGCGFGGSCFPKDVKAITAHAGGLGVATPLLDSVLEVNRSQPGKVIDMLERRLHHLAGKRITVLGIAFKPGTDDIRESPALPVIAELVKREAVVTVHDPIALETGRRALKAYGVDEDLVRLEPSLETALAGADAVALITSWPEYKAVPEMLKARDAADLPFVDGRRLIGRDVLPNYSGIGLSLNDR